MEILLIDIERRAEITSELSLKTNHELELVILDVPAPLTNPSAIKYYDFVETHRELLKKTHKYLD